MNQIKNDHLLVYLKKHIWLVLAVSIGFIALMLLAFGYIMSNRYWTTYSQNTDSYYQSTKEKTRAVIVVGNSNSLSSIQSLYDDASQRCKPSALYGWQTAHKSIKSKQAHCTDNALKLQAFGHKLKLVTSHLNSLQQLADMIKSAELSDEINEDSFAKTIETWTVLESNIGALKSSDAIAETKSVAREQVRRVITGWQALQSAHIAKNRAYYQAAVEKITSEYSALERITSTSMVHLRVLADSLQLSFDESFS